MNARADCPASESQLTDAFGAFITAANRLENSHWQLHDEVEQLRKQLEERNRALATSLADNEHMRLLLCQILDALPCGVIVLDAGAQELVLINPEARRLLNIPADGSVKWTDLPARVNSVLELASQEGEEQEFCLENTGSTRWLTVRYSPMRQAPETSAEQCAPQRTILIVRDVTSQRHAEQNREASRHLVALAEMAAVLAHEIRNPLGSLELLTALLSSDPGLGEESRQYIQHLQAGMRSLSTTVDNVLRFHSPGTPQLVPTKLASTLRSAVNFVRPLASQSEVNLVFDEALGETEIMADAAAIQQVILNLVRNALRHTPAGGAITISGSAGTNCEGRAATVEISDTGCGIQPEHISHIFEPGFSTARQSPGLGLTVCQRIMQQHHGTISVSSRSGEGTCFRLEFPTL